MARNPSTADADKDDPTIRRCISRAGDEACGSLIVVNLFARRSPDPESLKLFSDPIGPENDSYIVRALNECRERDGRAVVAWGARGGFMGRNAAAVVMAGMAHVKLFCLGITKTGEPRHPLYVARDQPLVAWSPIRGAAP